MALLNDIQGPCRSSSEEKSFLNGWQHTGLFKLCAHFNWTGIENKNQKKKGDSLLTFHRFYEWGRETNHLPWPFSESHLYRAI